MKHLLLLCSMLIISSSVMGNKPKVKTLFVLGEYPFWEWNEYGDQKTQPKYQGQVKDGKPDGLGVLTSTNGWKYFGSWQNGQIWSGTEYDNYGNIIFSWVEGKKKYHNLKKF